MKSTIKLLVISIAFLSGIQSFAQTLNYKDIGVEKPKGQFNEYISKDGSVYKEGDTITVGKGSGTNGFFTFIQVMTNMGGAYMLEPKGTNTKTIIKSVVVNGNKREGWKVWFVTKAGQGNKYLFPFEDAVASGEIKSFGMTSDEALTELKKLKDKLDLGLITQDEFAKKRAELSKYIK